MPSTMPRSARSLDRFPAPEPMRTVAKVSTFSADTAVVTLAIR